MPINAANMLAPLGPIAPIKPLDFGGGVDGSQREKLKFLREQFEETKRHNRAAEEIDRLQMAEALRREELGIQKQKEQAAFEAAAKLRAEGEKAYADFYVASQNSDFAGMARAAERLRMHGGLAEELGLDAEGRPSYRVAPSAEEYQATEAARAQQAAPVAGPESSAQSLNRLNALGYDLANEHVVDQGALMDTASAQMGPVLRSFRDSLPAGPYQESADAQIPGIQSLGLNPDKSIDLLGKLQGLSQPTVGKAIDTAQKQADAAAEAGGKPLTEKQKQEVFNDGRDAAGKTWKDRGLNNPMQARVAAEKAKNLLNDDNPDNDGFVAFNMIDMLGSRGPQSNTDLNVVLGISSMSTENQIREAVNRFLEGGFRPERVKTLIEAIDSSLDADDNSMLEFMDVAAKSLENPENHSDYVRGWREFMNSVPEDVLEAWNAEREARGLPTISELGKVTPPAAEEKPGEPGEKPVEPPPVRKPRERESGFTPTSNPTTDAADDLTSEFERPPGSPGSALEGPPTAPTDEAPAADGDFDAELRRQAEEAGLNFEAIKAVSTSPAESGGDPGAVNPTSGATGLIQFMPEIAKGLGTTTEELKKMSAVEQIPYVIKYFKDRGLTAEDDQNKYYVAVAAGGKKKGQSRAFYVDQPDDTVVYEKGSLGWEQNKPWRPADGGDITVGSIKAYGGGGKKGKPKKNPRALEMDAEKKPAGSPMRDDAEALEGI